MQEGLLYIVASEFHIGLLEVALMWRVNKSFNTLLLNKHHQSVFVIFSSKNPLSASEEAVGKQLFQIDKTLCQSMVVSASFSMLSLFQ
jgi:hypothetical protein